METNPDIEILSNVTESGEQMLKDLIESTETFIAEKEISKLSSSLKNIFYHGISTDHNVSTTSKAERNSPFVDI